MSVHDFNKVLFYLLTERDVSTVIEEKDYLPLEFVPGYDKAWLDVMLRTGNPQTIIGSKGFMTKEFICVGFEDGTIKLFQIEGRDFNERTDLKPIELFGEKLLEQCIFPCDIFKEDIWASRNRVIESDIIKGEYGTYLLIEKCNYPCKYCFKEMQKYEDVEDVSFEEIAAAVDILTSRNKSIKDIDVLSGSSDRQCIEEVTVKNGCVINGYHINYVRDENNICEKWCKSCVVYLKNNIIPFKMAGKRGD